MKRILIALFICIAYVTGSFAQEKPFIGKMYDKEQDVTLEINLYEETVKIPGQDVLGEVYGYLKKNTDSRAWIVMGVKLSKDGKAAELEIINDYGSEDLNASLTLTDDGEYVLKQLSGSTMKVASRGKWVKLPKEMTFKMMTSPSR